MGQIKTITINDEEYKINFMAGGDLKWISLVFGINAANSKFPCPFCKWKNEEINLSGCGKRKKKTEKIIEIVKETIDDIFDQNKYIIRNHDESLLLKDRQDSEQRLGYSNSPLLSFITFENIVVDILHLFLRITDRLLDILFNNLMESGFKVLN